MYLIGYILKPQGLRGEVKVEPVTPYLSRFNRLEKVSLQIKNIKPSSEYILFDAQPAINIAATTKLEIAKI